MTKATEHETTVPLAYLVECYWPGVTQAAVYEALDRVCAAAAEISAAGRRVRLIRLMFVPADEAVLGLFQAACPHAVREVIERAGLPADRISVAEDVAPPTGDSSGSGRAPTVSMHAKAT